MKAGFIYFFTLTMAQIFYRVFFRLSVCGKFPEKNAIFCSNHLSNFDPPLIASAVGRPIFFMAKKELFKNPVLGWYLKKLNAFPVDRTFFDRAAFKKAVEIVKKGGSLLFFPEGTRKKNKEVTLGDLKIASSYIIYNTSSPVIPVKITGSDNWKKFKFSVKFGKEIHFPERQEKYSREVATRIMAKLKKSLEEL